MRPMRPHPDLVKKKEKKKAEEPVVVEKRRKTFAEFVKMLEKRYHNGGETHDKTL